MPGKKFTQLQQNLQLALAEKKTIVSVPTETEIKEMEYPLTDTIHVNPKTYQELLSIIDANISFYRNLLEHIFKISQSNGIEGLKHFISREFNISKLFSKEDYDEFKREIINQLKIYQKVRDKLKLEENKISINNIIEVYNIFFCINVQLQGEIQNVLPELKHLTSKNKKLFEIIKSLGNYSLNDILSCFQKISIPGEIDLFYYLKFNDTFKTEADKPPQPIINLAKENMLEKYINKLNSFNPQINQLNKDIIYTFKQLPQLGSAEVTSEENSSIFYPIAKLILEISKGIDRLGEICDKLEESFKNYKIHLTYLVVIDQLIEAMSIYKEKIPLIQNYITEQKKIIDAVKHDKLEEIETPLEKLSIKEKSYKDELKQTEELKTREIEKFMKRETTARKKTLDEYSEQYNFILQQKRKDKSKIKLTEISRKFREQDVKVADTEVKDHRSFVIETDIVLANYDEIKKILSTDIREIKYQDFENLIYRLGGKIVSSSSGSSHCKVMFQEKLSSYILDTVGGFANPHGHQRSNNIYGFNLRLCQNAIAKVLPQNWRELRDDDTEACSTAQIKAKNF